MNFVERKWVVHPLSKPDDIEPSPGKRPILPGWQKLTKTPENIQSYIDDGYNVGLVCGETSNITVLDFDHEAFIDVLGDVKTLQSRRIEGRRHVFFKYNPDLTSCKHHDLGIEVMGNGNNLVIPPSKHHEGEEYCWNNPDMTVAKMPKSVENGLKALFEMEASLKTHINDCRPCIKKVLTYGKLHGAEAREYLLAVVAELKAHDVSLDEFDMLARIIYQNEYDASRTKTELKNIKPTPWRCSVLKSKLPTFCHCDGCDVGLEDFKQAELESETQKEAMKIATEGNPIDFLLQIAAKDHVGDKAFLTSLLLCIASQSCLNSQGLYPKVTGKSGVGKTDGMMVILNLVPDEYKLISSLSSKALFYDNGLKPSTIVFSDDVRLSDELVDTIKRSTSQFHQELVHKTLNKDREYITLTLPARIGWWLTSVSNDENGEMINRQLGIEVEDSGDMDERVLEHQRSMLANGKCAREVTKEVMICREIVRDIKEHTYKVKIPFVEAIKWKDASNRRNFPLFCDLIMCSAILNHRQRKIDNDGCLVATINEDLYNAWMLWKKKEQEHTQRMSTTELKIISFIKLHSEGVTIEDIVNDVGLSAKRVSQIMNGMRGNSGLLERIPYVVSEKQSIKDNEERTRFLNVYKYVKSKVDMGERISIWKTP